MLKLVKASATPDVRLRVYIAGPMTGIQQYSFPLFDKTAKEWTERGWDVVSPADITRQVWRQRFNSEFDPSNSDPAIQAGGDIYRDFLREDIQHILFCDAIALLPGWRNSKGVAIELAVATAMRLLVFDATTGDALPEESILEEAQRITHGDRNVDYGHPIDDYTRTARLWEPILAKWVKEHTGVDIAPGTLDPALAALCMCQVKISREVHRSKRDNRVDLAGYAWVNDAIRTRQEEDMRRV